MQIPILRTIINDGDVSVKWKTINVAALNGLNYTGGEGQIKFSHGESRKVLKIPILELEGKEGDILFEIALFDPEGGAKVENIIQTKIGE